MSMEIYNPTARYISAQGIKEAKVAFVSSAPRAREQSMGKGYQGADSRTLIDIAHKSGIHLKDMYLTYVVKERPPRDDITFFIDLSKKDVHHNQKYQMYVESLQKELTSWEGNVIVAVGLVALYALTGKRGITNWRGSVLDSTLIPGKKVVPMIDPYISFKQYMYTYLIYHDMQKVNVEQEYPEIRKRERKYRLNPTFIEVMDYMSKLEKAPRIGFDVEGVTSMSCISLAISETDVMSIPLVDRKGDYFTPDQEAEFILRLAKLLENPDQEHVAQNVIYDMDFLVTQYGIKVKNPQDSMIAHAICFPDYQKGLGMLTSLYTDLNYYKDDGKAGIKQAQNDRQFWLYNAKDSIACLESYNKLEILLRELNNREVYERQVSIVEPLVYMQQRGIRIDTQNIHKASLEAESELEPLIAKLEEMAGSALNPNSPKQLKEYFYDKLGHTPIRDKGKVTTGEKAMKKLSAGGVKEASLILSIRKLRKLKGTYLDMTFRPDTRFATSFKPVGTKNGRLSSSKTIQGYGGNSQNLPWMVKKYYLADKDYLIYEIDLSQAENRLMAYIAPELEMIKAFESDIDIHRKTASLVLSKSYEDISDEKGSSPLGNGTKSERYWGKTSNHSFNYDLGYNSAAERFELSTREAKSLIGAYHRAYPGIHKYHNWVKETLSQDGRKITNLMSRTRKFLGRWQDSLFKEAYNYIPQSTVADIINEHGLRKIYYNQHRYGEVELLNQVHDSIVFQIPKSIGLDRHSELLRDMVSEMEPTLKYRAFEFVIPAEVQVGYNLGSLKDVTPETLVDVVKQLDREKGEDGIVD